MGGRGKTKPASAALGCICPPLERKDQVQHKPKSQSKWNGTPLRLLVHDTDILLFSICHSVILPRTHLVGHPPPPPPPPMQAFYFPRSARYLIFLLRYHLSPSVPVFPPPLLSCHCCLFPLTVYRSQQTSVRQLQLIPNAAARILTNKKREEHITPVLKSPRWLPVCQWIKFKISLLVWILLYK